MFGDFISGGAGGGYGFGGGGRGDFSPKTYRTTPPSRVPSPSRVLGMGAPASETPQMPYQPEAPVASGMIRSLQNAGEGLLNPNSPYATKLRESMTRAIGQQGEARKRAAMLAAIRGGMGGGASPELLETEGDIGRESLEAQGEAGAGLALAAPGLGGQLLSPALSGEIGLQGQRLSGFLSQQQNQLEADRLATEAMLRELSLMGGMF